MNTRLILLALNSGTSSDCEGKHLFVISFKRRKVIPVLNQHSLKTGVVVYILILSTMWRRMLNFILRPIHPWHPLDMRLDEPQKCSGRGIEQKNVRC
jgi:hypothetical protein